MSRATRDALIKRGIKKRIAEIISTRSDQPTVKSKKEELTSDLEKNIQLSSL